MNGPNVSRIKKRAKTATNRGKNSNANWKRQSGRQRGKSGEMTDVFNASLVTMNDKHMSIGRGATAKGIVSLYNKGFVPKKSGKVSKRSNFSTGKAPLYGTVREVKKTEPEFDNDYAGAPQEPQTYIQY